MLVIIGRDCPVKMNLRTSSSVITAKRILLHSDGYLLPCKQHDARIQGHRYLLRWLLLISSNQPSSLTIDLRIIQPVAWFHDFEWRGFAAVISPGHHYMCDCHCRLHWGEVSSAEIARGYVGAPESTLTDYESRRWHAWEHPNTVELVAVEWEMIGKTKAW